MRVVVDTGPSWALLSKHDKWRARGSLEYAFLLWEKASFLLPRIALTETMVHATREIRKAEKSRRKQLCEASLNRIRELGWAVVEHTDGDFAAADQWWQQYSDWPIDYPDAMIAATARRLGADRLWTFDVSFGEFIQKALPNVALVDEARPR
ncbi:MAG TPA: PIN domain-containing protein [Phycisphaerae bacterium]|nr:PIN domain-containing protein [Phycisphaerae bacterium]